MTTSGDGRLCVKDLQHDFVMTSWNNDGASAFFADELLCPTCGAVLYRDDAREPWRWADANGADANGADANGADANG